MRLRLTVLACTVMACACAALPGAAVAAPQHNHLLTIHAVPQSIIAGEPVLIYGQLKGADSAGQAVQLYHRIAPSQQFTLISTTRTDSDGQYEFTRAEGIVLTNRSWYVLGPAGSHSQTIQEQVAALVTLAPSATDTVTGQALVFSGHLTPPHVGGVVKLQVQQENGAEWHSAATTMVGTGGNYQFTHAWPAAGAYDVRVVFPGDARNTAAASDSSTIVVQQAQVKDFTINTSQQIVPNQTPVTISGTLYEPGTTTPEPNTSVSLLERRMENPNNPSTTPPPFHEVTTTTTLPDGTYSFPNVESTTNEIYRVRTTYAPARATAPLFEGVQDTLTIQASSPTSTVGGQVVFSASVSPDKSGHGIELQRLGSDSAWHTVATGVVSPASTYQFTWTFGTAGSKEFRAKITGGPANVGSASTPVTVVVSLPPLTSLPTAAPTPTTTPAPTGAPTS